MVKGKENMVHVSFKNPCMVWSNFLVNGTIRIMHVFYLKSLKIIMVTILIDAPPSSLCDPKRVQRIGFAEMVRNLVPLPTSSTKRGRGVVLEAPGLD
jgi:hypothetical protein